MDTLETTWRDFREIVVDHIEEKRGPRLFRGQADSSWKLVTSFHRRNIRALTFESYFKTVVPILADYISTLERREIDVDDPHVNGAFLAYAQHHGFPTPLIDWTFSPYKAAYYAFSEIEDVAPQSNKVAIYVFDHNKWQNSYKQINDYNDNQAHVSLLNARTMGNHRQIFQQGTYMFTNVTDIEGHIEAHEKSNNIFLTKYLFNVKEKPLVMNELEAMGINAYSLFGASEGMFRFFKESVFRGESIGETPDERLQRIIEYWGKEKEQEEGKNQGKASN